LDRRAGAPSARTAAAAAPTHEGAAAATLSISPTRDPPGILEGYAREGRFHYSGRAAPWMGTGVGPTGVGLQGLSTEEAAEALAELNDAEFRVTVHANSPVTIMAKISQGKLVEYAVEQEHICLLNPSTTTGYSSKCRNLLTHCRRLDARTPAS